jgi:phospholipid/cholesterol/gamma-HCH transport system substrate-binding protein
MEAEAKYTLVGVVVLMAAAMLALGLVWLGGWANAIAYRHYTIYFNHQSMDGLDVNSAVKMRGIKVGVVSDLKLSSEAQNGVQVTVNVDERAPLRQGAQAYVKRNVVTGLATVEIANGEAGAPPLSEAPKGERYPVIAEGSSDLDKVATAVSRMAENGAEVLDKMNGVLTEQNRKSLTQTLANLRDLSDFMVQNKHSLAETIQALRGAAEEFRVAGANISQTAVQAESGIQGVSKEATITLKQAALTMENLQRETNAISQKLQNLSDTGSLEITAVGHDVRAATEAVTAAGRKLSNPRGLLLGAGKPKPGPGEKP